MTPYSVPHCHLFSPGQSQRTDQPRPSKSSSSGGGGGARGGAEGGREEHPFGQVVRKFEIHIDPQKWGWVPLGLAVAIGYMLTRGNNTRHISWQEFRTQYLERGEVERLQVVDKNVVCVYLRRDASIASTPGVSHAPTPHLIGGVMIDSVPPTLTGPQLPHLQHRQCGLL